MPSKIDLAYAAYVAEATPETLNCLFAAVTEQARRIARNQGATAPEDLAQEIVTKVWVKLGSFQGASLFSTFTFAVAKRHIVDARRKQKRKPDPSPADEEQLERDHMVSPSLTYDPERLPRATRAEKDLLHVVTECRDFEVAAKRLGISSKALRSRLERICEKQKR